MTLADLKKLNDDYGKVLAMHRVHISRHSENSWYQKASDIWGRGMREFSEYYYIKNQRVPSWMNDDLELPEHLREIFDEFQTCLSQFPSVIAEAKPPNSF